MLHIFVSDISLWIHRWHDSEVKISKIFNIYTDKICQFIQNKHELSLSPDWMHDKLTVCVFAFKWMKLILRANAK